MAEGALARQLQQAGVQTDLDYARNIEAMLSPDMDGTTRAKLARSTLERTNSKLGDKLFYNEAIADGKAFGRIW